MNTKEFKINLDKTNEFLSRFILSSKKLLDSDLGKEAREYLDLRKISKFSREKFEFGYFPSNDNLHLLNEFNTNDLKKYKLIFENHINDEHNTKIKIGYFDNYNLIWPIKDDMNRIVSLMGRSILLEDKLKELKISKYKYGNYIKSYNLFGLNFAKKSILANESVILVEGQLDCIKCHANGVYNVVALGGTSLSWYQLFLLKKHGAKKIFLLLDNDNPGKEAQKKIINKYNGYIKFECINLPSKYKDIDEYINADNDLSLISCI